MGGSMYDLIEQVNEQIESRIMSDEFVLTCSENCGLDPRACYRMYVSEECIVVPSHADRSLRYYGGFEYITEEFRNVIGGYVIYFVEDEDCRVSEIISKVFSDSP